MKLFIFKSLSLSCNNQSFFKFALRYIDIIFGLFLFDVFVSMVAQQQFLRVVGICLVLGVLTWCQQQDTPISQSLESDDVPTVSVPSAATPPPTTSSSSLTSDTWTSWTVVSDTATHQQLVIHPGCIGCGHCVRFASTNFAMNGHQAYVVSQENLDTEKIQQTIANCKVHVIELIEVS